MTMVPKLCYSYFAAEEAEEEFNDEEAPTVEEGGETNSETGEVEEAVEERNAKKKIDVDIETE